MLHQEKVPTHAEQVAEYRRQWNYPIENLEDGLLLTKYISRVCASAMRNDNMDDEDRDAVYLLLEKSSILLSIINLTMKT